MLVAVLMHTLLHFSICLCCTCK